MESVRLQGALAVGPRVVMKPHGQDPITSVIVELTENRVYADETDLGEVTLRFSHFLEARGTGGTKVTHRLEITGPAADQVVAETRAGDHRGLPEGARGSAGGGRSNPSCSSSSVHV